MDAAWVDGSGASGLVDGYTEEGETASYAFKVCLFFLTKY